MKAKLLYHMETAVIAVNYLAIVLLLTVASFPACKPRSVHNAIVLENGEQTFIYGAVHIGDTVWANLETHEVDNEYADVMQCVITD